MRIADIKGSRPERTRSIGRGPDSFRPLGPECTLVSVGQPLEPRELEQVAALLHDRPDVTLRFHSGQAETRIGTLTTTRQRTDVSHQLRELK
jgi:acyl-coenzyme A synthetase/AMP-(fatty) acid ligase